MTITISPEVAAALPGMIAAKTWIPVIGVPVAPLWLLELLALKTPPCSLRASWL